MRALLVVVSLSIAAFAAVAYAATLDVVPLTHLRRVSARDTLPVLLAVHQENLEVVV